MAKSRKCYLHSKDRTLLLCLVAVAAIAGIVGISYYYSSNGTADMTLHESSRIDVASMMIGLKGGPVKVPTPAAVPTPATTTPPTSTVCPNNGVQTTQSGSCGSSPRASVGSKSTAMDPLYTAADLTCEHLTKWSVEKTAQNGPYLGNTTGAQVSLSAVKMFTVTASRTSGGYVFSADFRLLLNNAGNCAGKIASLVVVLEQATNTGNDNSYGPGGQNQHVWAISGSENPLTAGKCNTPGLAQMCTGQRCNVTVPYISNTILSNQAPINLSTIVVPAATSLFTTILNLTALFHVSDANYTLMQANPYNYRLNILVNFDACCDRGSSCGIDINCDGTKETITTSQTRLDLGQFPLCQSNERCNDVIVKDVLFSTVSNNTNLNCLGNSGITNPFAVNGNATGTSISVDIYGSIACDTTNCLCSGAGRYTTDLTNKATLIDATLASDCINPLTNTSLISPSSANAIFSYQCAYPQAINCQVSAWSAWTVVIPCGVNNNPACHVRSARNRTVTTSPCHGGTSCPSLFEQKDEICSDNCTFMAPECNDITVCNGEDVCNTTTLCTTYPSTLMHCSSGMPTACATTNETTVETCSSNCVYSTPEECQAEECDVNTCLQHIECASYPDSSAHCVSGTSAECPVVPSQSNQPCSTDCIYTTEPQCTSTSCNTSTCTATVSCATPSDTATQCVSGHSYECLPIESSTEIDCVSNCEYNAWSDWSNYSSCAPIDPEASQSLCAQNRTRTRTVASVCPLTLENLEGCVDISGIEVASCTCPSASPSPIPSPMPSPTPSAPPAPECESASDCPTPPVCSTAVCVNNKCSIQSKVCPNLDNCNPGFCDPGTGFCTHSTTVCNDNNPCTTDTCSLANGQCVYTNITNTYASQCSINYCDPATGNGASTPLVCPTGTYCSVQDPQSLCRPYCTSSLNCSWIDTDQNACTAGVCQSSSSNSQCTIGIPLCIGSFCNSTTGQCVGGSNPCSNTICATGKTVNTTDCLCYGNPATCVNTPCATAVFNYTTQNCQLTPIVCQSDNNVCTNDPTTCDPVLGCASSRYTPVFCPIASCFNTGCNPLTGCFLTPLNCSDSNPLTYDFCDTLSGTCKHPYICDDNDPCTIDSFSSGQCHHIDDTTCCRNNTDCPGAQCIKNSTSDLIGTCDPPLVIGQCAGVGLTCTPSSPCDGGQDEGVCDELGFCRGAIDSCRYRISSSCDAIVCTPSGCGVANSDVFCDDGNSLTSDFCDPSNCPNSQKHCAHCPNTAQAIAGVFDLGECTCT